MRKFTEKLRRAQSSFLAWKLFVGIIFIAVGGFVFCLVLKELDAETPLREAALVYMLGWALLVLLIFLVVSIVRTVAKKPSVVKVARWVERNNPALMDILNCAIDIDTRKKEPTAFEELVLEKAESESDGIDFVRATSPSNVIRFGSMIAAILVIAFALNASQWNLWSKTLNGLEDLINGHVSGLSVSPGNAEFRPGTDLLVSAEIHRGPKSAEIQYYEKGELKTLAMRAVDDKFEFMVYDFTEPMKYRVLSPTLTSEWFELTTFVPPELHHVEWEISPPAYTGAEPGSFENFEDIKILEGSIVDVKLDVSPKGVEVHLLSGEHDWKVEPGTEKYELSIMPEETGLYHFELSDAAGHKTISHEMEIAVIPDEVPIVEITAPAKDIELLPDATLDVQAFASDDYGIAKAQLRISNKDMEWKLPMDMTDGEGEGAKDLYHSIKLHELGLRGGMVFAYHVWVRDNKEPVGQEARSEVYFVEVIDPEPDPMDAPSGQGEQKELPIRAMIGETKRIIRSNFAAVSLAGDERTEKAREIEVDSLKLKQALSRLHAENKAALIPMGDIDPAQLLVDSIEAMERSERASSREDFETAIRSAEITLANLVALYNLFKQPPMKPKESKGKGKGEGESKESEPSDSESQDSGENLAEKLEEIKRALEETKELAQEQKALNAKMSRASKTGRGSKEGDGLAKQQKAIGEKTEKVRDELYKKTGKLSMTNGLEKAQSAMEEAEGKLDKGDTERAEPDGIRAAEALDVAANTLEASMYDIAAEIVKSLQSESESLSKKQGKARGKTEAATPGSGKSKGLRGEQKGVNKGVQDLLKKMDRTAAALEEISEESSEALAEASMEGKQGDLEKSGKRAMNALLYDAFDKASQEQQKVERDLNKLSKKLDNIQQHLQQEGGQAIAEMIEEIFEAREEIAEKGEAGQKEIAQSIANKLGGMEQTKEDVRLQQRLEQIEDWAESNSSVLDSGDIDWLLKNTAGMLQEYFWQNIKGERMKRARSNIAPPKKYKKQVEAYYKRLADEL